MKFEANRVASFVVSYSGGDLDEYRVVGARGDLFSQPAYQVGVAIEHILTVNKSESTESFKATDHFGGELKYFSECILKDRQPEPDGEEGMLDVRVIAAIEQSLQLGTTQELPPYRRSKRPRVDQGETLAAGKEPELVGVHQPSEGQ